MKKIAIIYNSLSYKKDHLASLISNLSGCKIVCNIYEKSEDIISSGFIPDCVLIIEPHEPKLTHYPTYLITNEPISYFLSKKRFVRNILTYDAYLTSSLHTKKLLEDLIFSSRKIGSEVIVFNTIPNIKNDAADTNNTIISLSKEDRKNKWLVRKLEKNNYIETRKIKEDKSNKPETPLSAFSLCLKSQELNDYGISYEALKIIGSGSLLITYWSSHLYSMFGDNILYITKSSKKEEIYTKIKHYLEWAKTNPQLFLEKLNKLKGFYKKNFSAKLEIGKLIDMHNRILTKKGYSLNSFANELPSVSYIMRAGGDCNKIRDTLISLANQNYPNLQLIIVAYKPLKNFEDLFCEYKNKIKFKIIHDYGGARSTGIATGMKNVDTEYFAFIDDDDTINPNHLLSLLQSLEYHKRIMPNRDYRVAYSGAYFICNSYRSAEEREWEDEYLNNRPRKRAVEHFRFFSLNLMMSHNWYMMSNSWIAHKSLINEETVRDIETNSHEDLYFELQFAMHTNFAFSCEMTAAHHFHGANSTTVDVYRNIYDKTRRELSLYFLNSENSLFCRNKASILNGTIDPIDLHIESIITTLTPSYKKFNFQLKIPFRRSKKFRKIFNSIKKYF